MLRTIREVNFNRKRVLVRCDFDVPIRDDGSIEDTNRIDASLNTIKKIITDNANEVLLLAHRGQPNKFEKKLTMAPVAEYLVYALGLTDKAQTIADFFLDMEGYRIGKGLYLLENIRFDEREIANDHNFANLFADAYDQFVFEAFATSHRSHTSTVGISNLMESCAGYKVEDEIKHLTLLRDNPQKPCIYIIGGAKIEDKLPLIEFIASKVNKILVGGAVANTFLKSRGEHVKNSLVEDEMLDKAKHILHRFGDKIHLPIDHVWDANAIVDIGPETINEFKRFLDDSKTVFWNGCLGKTDDPSFSTGTISIAKHLADINGATRVVAGGDTVGVLDEYNLAKKMTFISTGGGAALEFLSDKELPALKALGYQNHS